MYHSNFAVLAGLLLILAAQPLSKLITLAVILALLALLMTHMINLTLGYCQAAVLTYGCRLAFARQQAGTLPVGGNSLQGLA